MFTPTKIKQVQIYDFLEIEKIPIQTKKDLELRCLALEKYWIIIQKCQMRIISIIFILLTICQFSLDWETSNIQSKTIYLSFSNWDIGNMQVSKNGK